jgi:hypothetical protein
MGTEYPAKKRSPAITRPGQEIPEIHPQWHTSRAYGNEYEPPCPFVRPKEKVEARASNPRTRSENLMKNTRGASRENK